MASNSLLFSLSPRVWVLVSVLLLGSVFAGCQREAPGDLQPEKSAERAAETTAATDTASRRPYVAQGVLRSVTPSGSHAVIAHEDIPGFMSAMTMPFELTDPTVLDAVAPGDAIVFVFTSGPEGVHIRSVEPVDTR